MRGKNTNNNNNNRSPHNKLVGAVNKVVVANKEKRGGVMKDIRSKKDIDQVLKFSKPRTVFSLLKMVFYLLKNFTLSLNFVATAIIIATMYHYLVKKKLFLKAFF